MRKTPNLLLIGLAANLAGCAAPQTSNAVFNEVFQIMERHYAESVAGSEDLVVHNVDISSDVCRILNGQSLREMMNDHSLKGFISHRGNFYESDPELWTLSKVQYLRHTTHIFVEMSATNCKAEYTINVF